ncbi:hypothetical protein E3P99_03136 [Wallemia hederae]|uniref:HPt domain-containing protein n=1 Tax=Wallemia hederae TaxID=1540922 RepID=A0A4T0FH26_9BASI|nr:hypothetical protein E3P99_03136 [Wallemia hederae]
MIYWWSTLITQLSQFHQTKSRNADDQGIKSPPHKKSDTKSVEEAKEESKRVDSDKTPEQGHEDKVDKAEKSNKDEAKEEKQDKEDKKQESSKGDVDSSKKEVSPKTTPAAVEKEDSDNTKKQETTAKPPPAQSKPKPDPSKPHGIVDMDTFGQILEMDEDENDREFSHGIVVNFYEQAEVTFKELDDALKDKDLHTLHTKGHFLKGSSAALGLIKVKQSCEAIQNLGRLQDPKTHKEISSEIALSEVETALVNAKEEYEEAEGWLKAFYGEQ